MLQARHVTTMNKPWWRHQIETFSALLVICAVNSPHNCQWRGALMFSLICVWINGWVNNREVGDLRRYRAHYDVTAMYALLTTAMIVYPNNQPTCVDNAQKNIFLQIEQAWVHLVAILSTVIATPRPFIPNDVCDLNDQQNYGWYQELKCTSKYILRSKSNGDYLKLIFMVNAQHILSLQMHIWKHVSQSLWTGVVR